MNPYWQLNGSKLWQGHVIDKLRDLLTGSVQCAITSPPYWGLRAYLGDQAVEWGPVSYAPMAGLAEIEVPAWRGCLGLEPTPEMFVAHIVLVARELWRVLRGDGCCWLNLGDSYAAQGGGKKAGQYDGMGHVNAGAAVGACDERARRAPFGLKPKDLIGIPWRVALALQADGWYLRSPIVWAKGLSFCPTYAGSCMPESVTDRPTRAHEMVFLLAKNERYFYDHVAVRETAVGGTPGNVTHKGKTAYENGDKFMRTKVGLTEMGPSTSRNLRDTWVVNPGGYKANHYATFPPDLIRPMILAGTSAKGACPDCGSPWERVVASKSNWHERAAAGATAGNVGVADTYQNAVHGEGMSHDLGGPSTTLGWIPSCSCYGVEIPEKFRLPDEPDDAVEPFECEACGGSGLEEPLPMFPDMETPCHKCKGKGQRPGNDVWEQWQAECAEAQANRMAVLESIKDLNLPTVPCVVLDPFCGSGTTPIEAVRLGRNGWGIELSKDYCDEHIIPRMEKPIAMEMTL